MRRGTSFFFLPFFFFLGEANLETVEKDGRLGGNTETETSKGRQTTLRRRSAKRDGPLKRPLE
jgi:hypothetical protein